MYRFITFLGIDILFFITKYPLEFMSGNNWWSTKYGTKLLADLVIFLLIFSDIPSDFYNSILVVL